MKYKLVQKNDHLAVHALFDSEKSAKRFLLETVPVYIKRGYYMDKTLRPEDFEVIPSQKTQ